MAVTQKVYTISIQTDAAQLALDKASKKLRELDAELEGLNRDSEAGQQLIVEMGKAAAEVDKLTSQVGSLNQSLDNLKPGTIGALRQELVDLAAQLNTVAEGSAEADRILVRMGQVKGDIKGLKDEIKALDPEKRIQAFSNFASGVVGAFGVATVAAETFGLSSTQAEEFTKKTQGVIAVLQGLEGVRNALDGETLKSIKSTLALGQAYIFSGTAAESASKTTRAALLATGLGAILILVGLLAANFDKVKEVGSSIAARFKPEFDAIGHFIDAVADRARNLASVLSFGLIDNAAKHAQAVADDYRRAALTKEAEHTARLLEIFKARGQDTLDLEVANAKRRLDALKTSTDEEKKVYADARKDYLVLAAQFEKRQADDTKAARLAHLNALAAAESARGADVFAQQLAAKKEQLAQLAAAELAGERVTEAQKIQLQSELAALQLTHDTQLAEKRRTLLSARLSAELAVIQARGTDALALITTQASDQNALAIKANAAEIALARQNRANLLATAQVDRAAVVAADAELYKLRLDRSRLFAQQQAQAVVESAALQKQVRDAILESAVRREKKYQDDLNAAQAAGARVTKRVADELAAELELKRLKAESDADVGGRLLIRLFGLTDAQAQLAKQQIASFAEQAGGLVNNLLAIAQDAADQRLTETQARLTAVTQQFDELNKTLQQDEQALGSATGARRDYLLQKIQQERAETEKLAASKAKAAQAEAAAEKEKQKLTKETTQLNQAAGLAATVASGAKAVEAAVGVIAGGSSLPFPANIFAIGAGLAVVVSALAQARSLSKSFGDGGVIEGGSHASGNDVPVMGGKYRVEGGEAITPVDATTKNGAALELIRTKGRKKQLTLADFAEISTTRVAAPPAGKGGQYGDGGVLGKGGSNTSAAGVGPTQVVVEKADLAELISTNRAMLAHLQTVAAATSTTAAYGPARLTIGPYEASQIELEKRKADLAQGFATV